jgi:hypothetical protein
VETVRHSRSIYRAALLVAAPVTLCKAELAARGLFPAQGAIQGGLGGIKSVADGGGPLLIGTYQSAWSSWNLVGCGQRGANGQPKNTAYAPRSRDHLSLVARRPCVSGWL